MIEDRSSVLHVGNRADAASPSTAAAPRNAAEVSPLLRKLGSAAYQLLAATRAADHYLALDDSSDRDTGAWLISSAFGIAEELAGDLDGLARNLKDVAGGLALTKDLRRLRTRAHQLHAATRAADHFLEQDGREDRSTGSWLIAYALGVADKLASELDDLASDLKRGGGEVVGSATDLKAADQLATDIFPADATPRRRSAATATAMPPLRDIMA